MFASVHTPGPATGRGRSMSPARRARGAMTEGRAKLGEGKVGEGKRIFESLAKQGATPARGRHGFLGDKDRTNQSPMRSRQQGGDEGQGSSSGSGKDALLSPSKQSLQPAASPAKAGKGKARSVSPRKGALQLQTPAPSRLADMSYATPRSVAAEPVPLAFAQRAAELKTPVAQLGRAGAARFRMGELMDQAAAASAGGRVYEAPEEEVQTHVAEWDEWPEIEYMAPSDWAKNTPYDFPPALDNLPRGAELGQMLAAFRPMGVYRPRKLSLELEADMLAQELKTHIEHGLDALEPQEGLQRTDEADDEGPWPNVQVAPAAAAVPAASQTAKARTPSQGSTASVRSASSTGARAPLARGAMAPPPPPSMTARVRSGVPLSSGSSRPQTTTAPGRAAPTRTAGPPAVRATAAKNSEPLKRALSSSSSAAARPAVRSALAPVRPAQARAAAPAAAATAPAASKMQLHPALLEVQSDALGMWVEQRLADQHDEHVAAAEGFALDDDEELQA